MEPTCTTDMRRLTAALTQVARAWRAEANTELADLGLSEALAYPIVTIYRMGDGVRQIALARTIGIEGPSLVRLLDQLERSGLVARRDAADDRRAKTLHLTIEGERVALRIESILDRLRARVLADVSDADIAATLRVLQAIADVTGIHLVMPAMAEAER
jgi:MarR family transcriptional regulator for hemolysin